MIRDPSPRITWKKPRRTRGGVFLSATCLQIERSLRPPLQALLLWALFASPAQAADQGPPESRVLARFRGGIVSAEDVAREEALLPKDEKHYRAVMEFEAQRNHLDWVRRIALRRLAVIQLYEAGPPAALALEAARNAGREFWVRRWHERCYGLPWSLPSDQDLLAQLGEIPMLPTRVKASHIFLRAETEAEKRDAVTRLESWRGQIGDLAAFQRMAETHSESQSRVRGGRLGWLRPGWIAPAAEEVLFAWPVGTMTDPLVLAGGVHLFFVEARREPEDPRPVRLEKARREVKEEALQACRGRRLREAKIPISEKGAWLEIGEWVFRAPAAEPERQRLIEDEILYQWAQQIGALTAEEQARCRDLEENQLLSHWLDQQVGWQIGSPTEVDLQGVFGDGSSWHRPRHLAGSWLKVAIPGKGDPLEFFDRLADLVEKSRQGQLEMATLAKQVGAQLESWSLRPQIEVAGLLGPVVFEQVKGLPVGSVAGPFQDEGFLIVVQWEAEEAPRPARLDEIRGDLEKVWQTRRAAQLRATEIAALLAQNEFRLVEISP